MPADTRQETVTADAPRRGTTHGSLEDAIGALPPLLTADEVAALLRTTRAAIYARAERGLLPGIIRDGRRLLFDRGALLQWLTQRRAASPGGSER